MTEITVHRELPATIDRVWRSWTDPTELATWFWPPSFGTTCAIELEVGGDIHIAASHPGMGVSGEFLAVDEPTALSFTWRWDGEDDESLVTLTLTPTDDGTRLELTHDRLQDEEVATEHEQGWNDCLDRLPAFLEE